MNIWLINHYSVPVKYYPLARTTNFAKLLIKRGHKVTIFCSSAVHNSDENLCPKDKKYSVISDDNINYVCVKNISYNGNGKKRIINMLQFPYTLKKVTPIFEKPDLIMASTATPFALRIGIKLAKKYRCPCIAEVTDLWPYSIVEYMNISNKNLLIKALYSLEKWLYKKSDAIIFSMEGGKDYIKEKGWDKSIDLNKVFHINNGIDIELQKQQKQQYLLIDDEDLNFNGFKVVYVGSIRKVNNLMLLVKCAELLKDKEDIRFIIYGDGNERENLVKYCEENGLSNIIFKGFVDKKYIPYILSKADLNIINVQQTNIMKYGCSLNKLFDYMASGKPILSNLKVGYDLLEKYECGLTTEDQTPEKMEDGILKFYSMPKEEYEKMCKNARTAAEDFDYKVLTDKLEGVIEYALSKE